MVLIDYLKIPEHHRRAHIIELAPLVLTLAVETFLVSMVKSFEEQGMAKQAKNIQINLDVLIRAREVCYFIAVLEIEQ